MSKAGLNAAVAHASRLKSFADLKDAEEYFFSYRDKLLKKIAALCLYTDLFAADYSADSLKELEKWYFDLWEKDEFSKIGVSQNEFEQMMSVYFGEVVVKNNPEARWVVREDSFVNGKYELFVNKGNLFFSIPFRGDWCDRPGNKRRNKLFRDYNKYFIKLFNR